MPPLHSDVKRFRGGLVFKAHRLVHRSTLGLRVLKMKRRMRKNATTVFVKRFDFPSPLRRGRMHPTVPQGQTLKLEARNPKEGLRGWGLRGGSYHFLVVLGLLLHCQLGRHVPARVSDYGSSLICGKVRIWIRSSPAA